MSDLVVELRADYYLSNFKQLVNFVASRYASLLTPEELAFQQVFITQSTDAQKLYVRLLCRSKSIFRVSKLDYKEILDIEAALEQLSDAGFVVLDQVPALEQLLSLFTRAEILKRVPLSIARTARRPEIEATVLEQRDTTQISAALLQGEKLVTVCRECHFDLYKLCFFGNLYQDMTDFVLRDLGLTCFEAYPISADLLAFQSRRQIDDHLQYYACAEQLEDVLKQDKAAILALHQQLPDLHLDMPQADPAAGYTDAHLRRRVARMINTLARQLERLGEADAALWLYRKTERPPSRERQARVLASQQQLEQALALCSQILQCPYTDEERQFAEQFGARLAKSAKVNWQAQPRYRPPMESLELQQRDESVELLAAAHFAQAGECFFTENTLFNGVFGLVYWDIIFAPVQGVFFNPFQAAPADFYETEFNHVRQDLLQQCWAELVDLTVLRDRVKHTFKIKQGLQNPMVNWQYLSPELLDRALQRIPLAHWQAVFSRLLADLRHNRNGFPDLVMFPQEGEYCLLEVKGPGDTLQKNQLRWMAYFAQHGIPHKVVHVDWLNTDDNTQ